MAIAAVAGLALPAAAGAAEGARGYEMVTPVDKTSGIASYNSGFAAGATRDGQHLFFYSQQPIVPNAPSSPWIYRADRSTDGWKLTTPLAAPLAANGDARLMNYDEQDLSFLASTSNQYDPLDTDFIYGNGAVDLYRFDAQGAEISWLSRGEIHNNVSLTAAPRASTPDGSHVVFSILPDAGDEGSLVPEAVGIGPGYINPLYENVNGTLRYLALDSDGTRLTDGSDFLGSDTSSFNALAANGTRVFFTATNINASTTSPKAGLYRRDDDGFAIPVPAAPAGANANATFAAATPDGSQVIFYTPDALLPADSDSAVDLYRLDIATGDLTLLSGGISQKGPEMAPAWVSDDGSRVYFIAGPSSAASTYLWDRGTLRTLAAAPLITRQPFFTGPSCSDARATADGRYFMTATTASLSPADHDGGAKDVYWYDADSGAWRMASTGPSDANGAHPAEVHGALPWNPSACGTNDHVSSVLSADGRKVFFQTAESLVPEDVDGKIDVYEWDAETNTVHLLTDGTVSAQYGGNPNVGNSYLLDVTPSGDDVFVATQDRLVPEDQDEMTDVYDIRVGGGFPHAPPTQSCHDSGCQGVPSGAPTVLAPGSEGFHGSELTPEQRHLARARVTFRRLSARALREFVRTGRVTLVVTTSRAGRITVKARASAHGHRVVVASGAATAEGAGSLHVVLRATAAGRRLIRHHGGLRIVLTATHAAGGSQSMQLTLPKEARR